MQTLIPMDDFGVFVDKQDTVRVDSRFVAQFFEKEHRNVILFPVSSSAENVVTSSSDKRRVPELHGLARHIYMIKKPVP